MHSAEGADVRRGVAGAVVSRGWGLLEMRRARLSLEEIFLQLTTTEEEGEEEAEADGAPPEIGTGDPEDPGPAAGGPDGPPAS